MNGQRIRARGCTFLMLVAAAWFGGCTCAGSLQPLESDETLAFTADLNGTWVSEDKDSKEKEYFLIESTGGSAYRVTKLAENKKLKDVYDLSLVQAGGYTFFDVAFKETRDGQTSESAYDMGVLPIHLIGRIWVEGDTLRLGPLDYEWMKKMTSSGALKLPFVEHHQGDDHLILLTAENDKLVEFVRQYAEDPDAFWPVTTFRRVPQLTEAPAGLQP